ncbi:hypothetical protein NPD8_3913 (plasmid) [Clostridium botulinum]|uniref:Uncharacterized protein n=1 Tax=Clostridium botulinum TaxID=1491 RepID=A0A1L7JMM1_CLOBO|nr:hypothetical protein NPD8_3913 [Clostridium botulinum]
MNYDCRKVKDIPLDITFSLMLNTLCRVKLIYETS